MKTQPIKSDFNHLQNTALRLKHAISFFEITIRNCKCKDIHLNTISNGDLYNSENRGLTLVRLLLNKPSYPYHPNTNPLHVCTENYLDSCVCQLSPTRSCELNQG